MHSNRPGEQHCITRREVLVVILLDLLFLKAVLLVEADGIFVGHMNVQFSSCYRTVTLAHK